MYVTCKLPSFQDDIIEAQVSDNADDSTDEESSEYSGLEDEEDDSDDEEDNSDWEEGSDEDEADEVHNMSTNEDSEDDTGENKVRPIAVPMIQDEPSTSTAQLPTSPVEDEYAYDSSDEEVILF